MILPFFRADSSPSAKVCFPWTESVEIAYPQNLTINTGVTLKALTLGHQMQDVVEHPASLLLYRAEG